ncbi:MAG: bifunctional [glutamine synthetase] adenylyltransferase/[glutamine synthetase]-adenylyl-L-tyrosine phosphorylase [Pseudomonadota bacterium]
MFRLTALSEDPKNAIAFAAEHAPYLAQLQTKLDGTIDPAFLLDQARALCRATKAGEVEAEPCLREAKQAAHLAIAALDLSGQADLAEVTHLITEFADAATDAALTAAARAYACITDGLFVTALGKMGAHELNYSSDIDVAAFFDPDQFSGGVREPSDAAARIIRDMSTLLSQHTANGYVFRTDLRLRPDPSSTPVAVSTRRAALYYESVGQNWERMVWIKGRIAAGDQAAGRAFLDDMQPFIWRRHLDYWAISDVHAIKDMINAKAGDGALNDAAADLKLGPGGIREIEFFVQTQQIILGGRHPQLRVRGTEAGLARLTELGIVSAEVSHELIAAYRALRAVEHRIQMLNDEQTHTLPAFETKRAAVAALCGYSELDGFDADLIALRRRVHAHYQDLFADELRKRARAVEGNLVFTGVDDDPRTVTTLQEMGFSAPSQVIDRIRQWHRGRTPATRSPRGRELLTAILPDLLAAMGRTGEADEAFRRFGRFFEGLRAGVQTLSMLVARPALMDDLVTTLAIAPRIADILARRPGLLEALVSFADRKPEPDLSAATDFETQMDVVRRWHGERAFLIGHELLHGQLAARDAATAWSDLADKCIQLMARAAEDETIRRYGPAPGVWAVIGLGKLGGREMTGASDLDLLVIYDAKDAPDAQSWFTRFTQRLIAGLSAETAEGRLYETDMRLRPSGRAGPVATSIKAFETYHQTSAWTWEHMALTRLRAITGDEELSQHVRETAERVINSGETEMRTRDIADMRRRLHRDKPPAGDWDLKMRAGGLVDVEFITQHAILTAASHQTLIPDLIGAQAQLLETGIWSPEEHAVLKEAFEFLQALQQVQRMAQDTITADMQLSEALKDRLCRAASCSDFDALEARLAAISGTISALFQKKIAGFATEP